MTEIMNGEAMSIIDRSTFDRAAMSREYLEQLPRAELLALAKYLREMAVALNVNEGNRTDDLA